MQTITKIFVFSGALGTFGAGFYGVSYLLSGYTLGEKLKDKGHELLNYQETTENETEKTIWKPIFQAYLKSSKKFHFDNKISMANETDEVENVSWENISKLKNICLTAISLNSYKAETELLTESFCMRPVSVKDLVGKKSKVLAANDDNEWDKKIAKYSDFEEKARKIKEIALATHGQDTVQTNRDKFKAACKGLENTKTYEKYFHESYGHFVDWCIR